MSPRSELMHLQTLWNYTIAEAPYRGPLNIEGCHVVHIGSSSRSRSSTAWRILPPWSALRVASLVAMTPGAPQRKFKFRFRCPSTASSYVSIWVSWWFSGWQVWSLAMMFPCFPPTPPHHPAILALHLSTAPAWRRDGQRCGSY